MTDQLDAGKPLMTDEQRSQFLELIRDRSVGYVRAALRVGVTGYTKGQLKQAIAADADLQADIDEAQREYLAEIGLSAGTLLKGLASITADEDNPSRLRAIERGLYLQGITFKEQVEHTGDVEVHNPDVAAAIDRFTALTAAAVRAASRDRQNPPALES